MVGTGGRPSKACPDDGLTGCIASAGVGVLGNAGAGTWHALRALDDSVCGTCKWEISVFKQFEAKSTIRFWDDVGNF